MTTIAEAIARHLAALPDLGYAGSSIERRTWNLRHFEAWLHQRGIEAVCQLDRGVFTAYQDHIGRLRQSNGEPLSLYAQRNSVATLRNLARWLRREGHVSLDLAGGLSRPRIGQTLPRSILSREEVARILTFPDVSTPAGVRSRAILELMYGLGLTGVPLSRLAVTDYRRADGVLVVPPLTCRRSATRGQARPPAELPLPSRVIGWLDRYLAEVRPPWAAKGLHRDRLFLVRTGKPISRLHGWQVVRAACRALDLPCHGGTYVLRHARATHLLDGGADLRYVVALLNFADLGSAAVYQRTAIASLQAMHRRCHPAEAGRPMVETEPAD